jgi:ELWxxDGT repeat protein
LYFAADNGVSRKELWRSDGTSEGTYQILDISPFNTIVGPENLAVVGDTLYFSYGDELWRSDGTDQGTIEILLPPGSDARSPNLGEFVAADGELYFSYLWQVWTTDGTTQGTSQLTHFHYGDLFDHPNRFYASGGKVFFHADDGLSGSELWMLAEPVAGDFNSDGDVDGGDFLRWQREVGSRPLAPGVGSDGDGDDLVGGGDLDVWEAAFAGAGAESALGLAPVSPAEKIGLFTELADASNRAARDAVFAVAEYAALVSDPLEFRFLRRLRRRG